MIPVSRPFTDEAEKKALEDVLSSGMLVQGPKVKEFEEKFAQYIGTKHAVATSSGTTALHLAVEALGIGKDDEVITTPFTFIATANSILYCNAKPVFVDIDARTFNIDASKIENAITDKTKAIIAVHLYGHPADMDKIMEIAGKHNLKVIEDAAQAHGAVECNGKKVGTLGNAAVFSFYGAKNMTTGEGGIITTNDDKVAERIRIMRDHGQSSYCWAEHLGFNMRMTDLEAAIGIEQLKKLDMMNEKRIKNAQFLSEHLKDIVETPFVAGNVKHVFHQYTIKINNRDDIARRLNEKGIGTGIYYSTPIHLQPLYKKLFGYKESIFPVAEDASKRVLSLPVHPALEEKDLKSIVDGVKEAVKSAD